jgi:hypothetical protein
MLASLRNRLKRLERRLDAPRETVSVWDVLAGAAPPEQLPPEVLALLEAAMSDARDDAVEERIEAALRLPCGLRELRPSSPGAEPSSSEPPLPVNWLGTMPSRNGNGHE